MPERWRDVPAGEERRFAGVRMQRTKPEIDIVNGREYVEVRYLEPVRDGAATLVEMGELGLLLADDTTESEA